MQYGAGPAAHHVHAVPPHLPPAGVRSLEGARLRITALDLVLIRCLSRLVHMRFTGEKVQLKALLIWEVESAWLRAMG